MIVGIVISVTISTIAASALVNAIAPRAVEQNLNGLISVEVGRQLAVTKSTVEAVNSVTQRVDALEANSVTQRVDSLEANERNFDRRRNWHCGAIVCSRTREICDFAQAKFSVDKPGEAAFKMPCVPHRIAYCHSFGEICFVDIEKCQNHAGQNRGDPSCLGVE